MKYFVLVMLLSANAAQAETDTLIPITDDISIMDLGEITKKDLGEVTAGDLSNTPALPLPEDQSLESSQ